MGKPKAARALLTSDELQLMRDVFRVVVGLENPKLPDSVFDDWEVSLPSVAKSSYERFAKIARQATKANWDLALSDEQRRKDWDCPSWASYYRSFAKPDDEGITAETLKDFLFIAEVMLLRIERDQQPTQKVSAVQKLLIDCAFDLEPMKAKAIQAKKEAAQLGITPIGEDEIRQALAFRTEREWQEIGKIEKSFVPLLLITDRNEESDVRQEIRYRYSDIGELLKDTAAYPFLVVLGEPGAGKTTILQHLEAKVLRSYDAPEPPLIPLLVTLANYRQSTTPSPADWLEILWASVYREDLPSFRDALASGQVLLLLDGFNEMGGQEPMERWSQFITSQVVSFPGNKVVVTCRRFDYTVPLALNGRYIPHARIAPMDPETIKRFLERSGVESAQGLWTNIVADANLLSFYGAPLFLRILADTGQHSNAVVLSPANLFARLVWRLLRREMARTPALFDAPLLTQLDRARVSMAHTFSKVLPLPDDGKLIPFLSDLAFRMPGRAGIALSEARELMADYPDEVVESAIKAACATSILKIDLEELSLTFHHQLFQEFFAARKLAQGFDDELWALKWKIGEVESFEPISLHEQLPALPGSGWEETTVLAVSFAKDQEGLINRILKKNPLLAARSAASQDASISEELFDAIQSRLVQMMKKESADLRARIQAGLLVKDLKALGYEDRSTHFEPPMIQLGGDIFVLGADPADVENLPCHANQLALPKQERYVDSFLASAYHVTNAEYARFIAAGGYENETWWEGGEAKRWRTGEGLLEGIRGQLEYDIERHHGWGRDLIQEQIGIRWSQVEADRMLRQMDWTLEQREAWVREEIEKIGKPTHPGHWWDNEFKAPTQPVVGISWFEANAYAKWLSSVSGKPYRLLDELEHEAAARGKEGRIYAYGMEYDPHKCNTFPTHIWKPTPIGLYETGQPLYDLTGNAWTWTSSEDIDPDRPVRQMTVRGGSYDTSPAFARAFCRDSNFPGYRDRYIGLRLAMDLP